MLIIGEKLNGAIKSVAEAIKNRDEAFIRDLAKRQLERRADYIDVCSGVPNGDADVLKWMIELIQADHPDVRFSLDSPNADTILSCVPLCKNPGFINSVSLEGDKIDKIFGALADQKGWKIVALLLDETGMPETVEKRMENFGGIMKKIEEYKIDLNRIYFDPLVFSIGTSPDSFTNFIGAAKLIREQYPKAHIVSGLSNISFGLPSRKTINQAFLVGAMMCGMDSAIIDPLSRDLMGSVYAAEALLGIDEYCIEYLDAYREDMFGIQK
ncbi:MAG: dihydropteroate synthase [Clostridia bacterium]|nr:dihydropteroate synthase [Clostridia bacterium]